MTSIINYYGKKINLAFVGIVNRRVFPHKKTLAHGFHVSVYGLMPWIYFCALVGSETGFPRKKPHGRLY